MAGSQGSRSSVERRSNLKLGVRTNGRRFNGLDVEETVARKGANLFTKGLKEGHTEVWDRAVVPLYGRQCQAGTSKHRSSRVESYCRAREGG